MKINPQGFKITFTLILAVTLSLTCVVKFKTSPPEFLCTTVSSTDNNHSQEASLSNEGYEQCREAFITRKQFDKAITLSERQLDEKGKGNDENGKTEANLGLGKIYLEMGDTLRAKEYLNKVLATAEHFPRPASEASYYLGWIEEKSGHYDAAIKAYMNVRKQLEAPVSLSKR